MTTSTCSGPDKPVPADPKGELGSIGSPPSSADAEALEALLQQARTVTEGLQGMRPADRNDPIRLAKALASEVVELLEEARDRPSRPPPSSRTGG
jgi:hypothetical protein